MVMPLLGGMELDAEGGTTEAGIRRALEHCARPVVLDHAEYETARAELRRILKHARSASSSGGRILRGSASSVAKNFRPTSMFLLASVAERLHDESDQSRFTVLSLTRPRHLDPLDRCKEWESFQREVLRHFTVQAGRRLLARTLKWFRTGKFDELHAVVKSAANAAYYDARTADQLGTLATGTWTLLTDEIPEESEVLDWLRTLAIKPYRAGL